MSREDNVMAKSQLDDFLDARAEVRQLQRRVTQAKDAWNKAKNGLAEKAAYDQAKNELADKLALAEDILVQEELRQGRLPFTDLDESNKSKPGKRAAAQLAG
jgi:hypothetical protein